MPKAPEPFSTCQKTTKSLPRISPKSYCYNAVPNRFLAHFSTSRTNGPRSLSRAKAGTHSPSPTGSHTAAYTAKQGRFRWGRYYYPRTVSHVSETLRGQGVERQTLPLLGLGRGCSQRTQRAFGAAMRLCASLFRGVAAPLGCVIPLLFLSPHRWASRFWSAASLAHRKLSACSLVTAVRFLNRCSRRSMRGTCPSEQRSGCQF